MFQGNLPTGFWGDSVCTAAHLIKRTPTHLHDDKSPYEILHNIQPSYDHLRVFGCLAYAMQPLYLTFEPNSLQGPHLVFFLATQMVAKVTNCMT